MDRRRTFWSLPGIIRAILCDRQTDGQTERPTGSRVALLDKWTLSSKNRTCGGINGRNTL